MKNLENQEALTAERTFPARSASKPLRLVTGEVCLINEAGEEGIAYDQGIIHFYGDDEDSEREILVQSPNAPKIAEQIVRAVNSYDAMLDALKVINLFATRREAAGKTGITNGQFEVALVRVRAALSKAEPSR